MELYRVLLADDEAEIRQGISRKIDWAAQGFELAGEAENGAEALELAEQIRPDVVLTDIKMPFMDGLELCRRLRRELPAAKLVVFSGFDDFEYARQAVSMGVSEYIMKPVNARELENVLAGRHCRLKSGFLSSMLHTPWQRREEKAAVERCMEELEFVGLADHYAEAASSLSYGNQRLLEIARALASDPRLLILDEPAGGMNDQETVALVDTIAAIRDRGITVLLIEHDMRLVMQICEHLVVLENGTLIAQGTPDHVRNHPAVIEAYLGSDDSETW